MNKVITLILCYFISFSAAQAYYFATDLKSVITGLSQEQITIKVLEPDNKERTQAFPAQTILKGKILKKSKRKRLSRSEKYHVQLEQAVLPNGSREKLKQKLIIKPSTLLGIENGVKPIWGFIGSIPVTLVSYAFIPIGFALRGIWQGSYDAYFAEQGRKWRDGLVGFVKGATEPISTLVLKGDKINIYEGQLLLILDSKKKSKKVTAVPVKLNKKTRYNI